MRQVKSDQISQRSHVGMGERGKVLRDLHLELKEQRGELVVGVSEDISSIGINNGRPEALHYVQGVLGECDRVFIARIAKVAVIKKPHVTPDPGAVERVQRQQ